MKSQWLGRILGIGLIFLIGGGSGRILPVQKGASVKKSVADWVSFWNSRDLNQISRLFVQSPDLTYFSSEKPGLIRGYHQVVQHHRSFGFVPGGIETDTRLWVEDLQVFHLPQGALVTGIWFFQPDMGKIQQGPMTVLYRLGDGKYRIMHMNFSRYRLVESADPTDPVLRIPANTQGISGTGRLLISPDPPVEWVQKYKFFRNKYRAHPDVAENVIWYGRWAAYTGDYRKAIRIFTRGIRDFPSDPRFLRHRGHRYISIRLFDRAIRDLEEAVAMIRGREDRVEPDGMPNQENIPVSSLHTNIYYHLGLAYYLKGRFSKAIETCIQGIRASRNDDMKVAFTHWLTLALRKAGEEERATEALNGITREMNVIENTAYHQLCLFYKGVIGQESLLHGASSSTAGDAVAYGLASWFWVNGMKKKAEKMFTTILEGSNWASFGYIATETDYLRYFKNPGMK